MSGGSRSSFSTRPSLIKEDVSGEYEEERVPEDKLQSNFSYASVFAGRHTAAPELVIGPQFVLGGATFFQMVVGTLLGNLFAVLAWRYVCAPIAVAKRFSTYYMVKRICGNTLLAIYNLVVALVLGAIAGFMFILATNAVAIAFGLTDVPSACISEALGAFAGANEANATTVAPSPAPDGGSIFITDPRLLFITVLTGAATTVVAMFGFKFVTIVSYFMTPPMFIIIGYLVYAACADLGFTPGTFLEGMSEKVYTGEYQPGPGVAEQTLVVVMITAFVQDQFCHIGQLDLTLFRFAEDANAGWQSAWGMYLGHFVLWIGAGILFRSQEECTGSQNIVPGPMAYRLAGYPGLLAILFASWSTANPFLYAGGLGLKSSLAAFGRDDVTSRQVTGVMGVIATVIAFAPGIVSYFLGFLQFSGAFLVPVGAIIFCDHVVLPKMGKQSEYSYHLSSDCTTMNHAALAAWGVSTWLCVSLIVFLGMPPYYSPFLCFPLASFIYVLGSKPGAASQADGQQLVEMGS